MIFTPDQPKKEVHPSRWLPRALPLFTELPLRDCLENRRKDLDRVSLAAKNSEKAVPAARFSDS
jgi:hypothetical protein